MTVGAALFIAGGVAGWLVHVQPKRALARYKVELAGRGENLTLAAWLPPPPLRTLDGTEALRRAIGLFRNRISLLDTNAPKSMEMIAPARALAGWQRTDFVDLAAKRPATNQWRLSSRPRTRCR